MHGIFLDIETSGLDPYQHSPIEIAIKVVDLTKKQIVDGYTSVIKCSEEVWIQSDRTSLEVNGFTWDKLTLGKEISLVKEEIITQFQFHGIQRGKALFICQNPSFDRAFFDQIIDVYTQEKLNWPYHWLDLASMHWARIASDNQELPKDLSLSKNTIAKNYSLPIEPHPHQAMNGVEHLILCYQAVMNVKFTTYKD